MSVWRRTAEDAQPPLWVTRPELRPLAELLAADQRWELRYLEDPELVSAVVPRSHVENQIRAVLAAGWRLPTAEPVTAGTVDELEALPVGTVVTDPDGHVWVRNQVGEWCEPYPAGIDPHDLLADGPVTVHHTPADLPVTTG